MTGFREIMIAQHANEPNRKLLETRSWHFTIFIDRSEAICGFELTDANEAHLLKWRRGHPSKFYRVENVGKGYRNHDVLHLNGIFQSEAVVGDLMSVGKNIRSDIRGVLLEGIAAYAQPG